MITKFDLYNEEFQWNPFHKEEDDDYAGIHEAIFHTLHEDDEYVLNLIDYIGKTFDPDKFDDVEDYRYKTGGGHDDYKFTYNIDKEDKHKLRLPRTTFISIDEGDSKTILIEGKEVKELNVSRGVRNKLLRFFEKCADLKNELKKKKVKKIK